MPQVSAFELAFYKHICTHPTYFDSVKPSYFNDEKVRAIYTLIRDYYKKIKDKGSSIQITPFDLSILLEARNPEQASQISEDALKDFVVSNKDIESSISEDYVQEQLEKWVKWSRFKESTTNLSQEFKKIENENSGFIGINDVDSVISHLKDSFSNNATISFDNSYIDFFDPEQHIVNDLKHYSTGYKFIDTCADGGYWDGSLWIIAGAPKSGKSVTLQNFLARSVVSGNNSAYISLELQDGLSLKRLSSIVFDIKISEYDKIKEAGADALRAEFDRCTVQNSLFTGGTLNSDIGKVPEDKGALIIKTFPTGTLTVTQLENFLINVEKHESVKRGYEFKFKTVFLDYINIMCNEKNPTSENTYLKIKTLAEDLRAMAQRHDWCLVSATQTNREQADRDGITVSNIAESVGLNATVDMMFGIIKTVDMDANSVIDLKCLLSRVSGYINYRKEFRNNKEHLRLTESDADAYIDSTIASNDAKRGTKYGEAYSQRYTDSLLTAKDAVNKAMSVTNFVQKTNKTNAPVEKTDINTLRNNNDTLKELESEFDILAKDNSKSDGSNLKETPQKDKEIKQIKSDNSHFSILDSLNKADALGI